MMKMSSELIKEELGANDRKNIYTIMENALIACNEIIKEDFFHSAHIGMVRSDLLNFSIVNAFDPRNLSKNFKLKVNIPRTPGGKRRVEISTDKLLMTIKKSKENKLPEYAKHRKDYSENNKNILGINQFNFLNDSKEEAICKNYAIITFDVLWDGYEYEYKYIDMIIPDAQYSHILDWVSMNPSLEIVNSKEDIEDEDRIIAIDSLKDNIKKEIIGKEKKVR